MIFAPNTNLIPKPQTKKFSYSQIFFYGLNYSFRKLSPRRIRISLQYAKKKILRIPTGIIVRTFKRRLVLFGEDALLKSLICGLRELRPPNIYTGKGVRIKNAPYITKPGKVRRK